ncbi:hypothetical protein Tsubulata_021582 [Turnera subulata]|uniref:Uncharacterized protein n=1 Tax=Turnera subulata TaxID=218843 RepID=A0A9Q0FRK1_9ROSI|nr:hypothetical protein Tsubulata_021582 [Turnera subulata]
MADVILLSEGTNPPGKMYSLKNPELCLSSSYSLSAMDENYKEINRVSESAKCPKCRRARISSHLHSYYWNSEEGMNISYFCKSSYFCDSSLTFNSAKFSCSLDRVMPVYLHPVCLTTSMAKVPHPQPMSRTSCLLSILACNCKIVAMGFDEKFFRTWEYYFDYSAAGFMSGMLGNYQVVFSRPGNVGALGNPYKGFPSANNAP